MWAVLEQLMCRQMMQMMGTRWLQKTSVLRLGLVNFMSVLARPVCCC